VRLRLRDGQGRLQGDDLMVTSDNFAPADPPKGSTVFVARGPHKGRVATVKVCHILYSQCSCYSNCVVVIVATGQGRAVSAV
jgi:hypothetical protein